MECQCGENTWSIKLTDEYGIAICTCSKCGYIETLYLEEEDSE